MSDERKHDQKLSELLQDLQRDYLEKWPSRLILLRALFQAKDWPGLEQEFHKLKGTGKTYGLPEVSLICEKLEHFTALHPDFSSLEFLPEAFELLERMKIQFEKQERYDLSADPVALRILSLKIDQRGS